MVFSSSNVGQCNLSIKRNPHDRYTVRDLKRFDHKSFLMNLNYVLNKTEYVDSFTTIDDNMNQCIDTIKNILETRAHLRTQQEGSKN